MESFTSYFNNNYMLFESIMYADRTFFKRIIKEDANPTPEEQVKIQQQIANTPKVNNDKNDLETIELIKTYKANPTSDIGIDARNKVIEKYMNLIHSIAWKQQRLGTVPQGQHDDLFQNGIVSFMHGIDKYDPESGVPFLAYIKNWILAGIKNPFNTARKQSIHSDNIGADTISLDAQISGDRGEYADRQDTVSNKVADPSSLKTTPLDDQDDEVENEKLLEYLKRLPQKEATALKMYFIDDSNYEDIGNTFHMSKVSAKYFVDKALERLRTFAREQGFTPDQTIKTSALKGSGEYLKDRL